MNQARLLELLAPYRVTRVGVSQRTVSVDIYKLRKQLYAGTFKNAA